MNAHVNQASQLILLTWWSFGQEQLKHLLGICKVLHFHISHDGGSEAIYSVPCQ
jgi:hypothetical protein